MKKTILSALLIATVFSVSAQKLKDKFSQVTGGGSQTEEISGETGNQFIEAEKFLAGEKRNYFIKNATGDWINASDKAYAEKFYNAIKKDESGNVSEADSFKPNSQINPLFFSYNNDEKLVLIFLNGAAYKCDIDLANNKVTEIRQMFATSKMALINKNASLLESLTNYIQTNKSWYDDVKKAEQEAQQKAKEEKRAKESVEGLDVASIKIKFSEDAKEIQYNQRVQFSIEATLKDGSKKITPGNSEYLSAYSIKVDGVSANILNGGTIFQDFLYVPNDVITITASLKSNPKITTQSTLKMDHSLYVYAGDSKELSFGSRHTTSNWDRSPDARVEIKKVKNTLNNEDLIAYKIYFGASTEPDIALKVSANTKVTVHTDATTSTTGSVVSSSDKGYAAGNIKVIMDPSVPESINFTTSAKGGVRKGANGTQGMTGADGKIETVKAKVSW
ncbi:MAG: hypothetical protein H6599_01390 [Flavobacteriales bacterium]|nr:hypothetical protein [Flavobacteriales bacterium]